MDVRNDITMIESLRDLERCFSRRQKRTSVSAYSRRSTLPGIPAGSDIFEQVLKEMRSENKKKHKVSKKDTPHQPAKQEDTFYDMLEDVEEPERVKPTTAKSLETYSTSSKSSTEFSASAKSPEMYLSCNRYPWICATTKCVHQTLKISNMKWNSIKAVAIANEDFSEKTRGNTDEDK